MAVTRVCGRDGCDNPIPADAHANRKNCSTDCTKAVARENAAKKKRAEERRKMLGLAKMPSGANASGVSGKQTRRGALYEMAKRSGILARCWENEISRVEGMELLKALDRAFSTVTSSHMSQWLAAYEEDLHRDKLDRVRRDRSGEEVSDPLLEDFAAFRAEFFETMVYREGVDVPKPEPYLTPPFHHRWVDRITYSMRNGKRLAILSPPRHGKTDLLTHFCAWQICRNPNIRILWVGGNESIAKQSVNAVRELLESNEKLIEAFGGSTGFEPPSRSSKPWSDKEFTVATRTVELKSHTMRAVGRGGRTLSLDADVIIVDDIIDHDRTVSPESRKNDSQWLKTQISSRKMAHTAVICIGSRQHPDDLYGEIIESDAWESIVESAHDPACTEKADDHAAHTDCVLFPEINPYSHLMAQRDEFGPALFSMVYQNDPESEGVRVFDAEVVGGTKNERRMVGDTTYTLAPGLTVGMLPLVAGIDPASAGTQACFLWAIHPETKTRLMLDMIDEEAGGIQGFLRVMQQWYEKYYLDEWVLETNAHQTLWLSDDVRDYAARHGIRIHTRNTGKLKGDAALGVTHHGVLMGQDSPLPGATKRIDIPWAPDAETRRKAEKVVRGYLTYEGNINRKRGKTDIVMAGWIPEEIIRSKMRASSGRAQNRGRVSYTYSPIGVGL